MTSFTPTDPASLPGAPDLRALRQRALDRFARGPLPTDAEEIWRYSRIGELDLGGFRPVHPDATARSGADAAADLPGAVRMAADRTPGRSALVVTVDGALSAIEMAANASAAVRVELATGGDGVGGLTSAAQPWDALAELNTGQAPTPIVVEALPGTALEGPVVICHWAASGDTVTFPRVLIRTGAGAQLTVVEYHLSADVAAWSDPVTELDVGDGSHLEYLAVQDLGPRFWHTAYVGGLVGRDAGLRCFTAALGGDYARVRTDSRITGAGGEAQLLALYCGDGTQMHDFRTLQDHEAPKSVSDLVFKGAVADESRSAYSGLIRVRRGAAGTRAFQTNRNLVLSDSGLATYSVPNLDIQENDVSCSHASATGPIDAEQRFYLESRGVPSEVADRLIVLGFFDDLLGRLPLAGVREHLSARIGDKLGVRRG